MAQRLRSSKKSAKPKAPPTPEVVFGQVLRERRQLLGLKQVDLEADDHVDRSYISKLELGKRQVCLRTIIHLAQSLSMRPGELIEEVVQRIEREAVQSSEQSRRSSAAAKKQL